MHPDYDGNLTPEQAQVVRLWACGGLIFLGTANFWYWETHPKQPPPFDSLGIFLLLWLASGALIGAGIFGLFKRHWLGAAIGVSGAFIILGYLVLNAPL